MADETRRRQTPSLVRSQRFGPGWAWLLVALLWACDDSGQSADGQPEGPDAGGGVRADGGGEGNENPDADPLIEADAGGMQGDAEVMQPDAAVPDVGMPDVGAQCMPGERRTCAEGGEVACPGGEQVCDPEGQWGPCEGVAEICDTLDNDCDGAADEALPRLGEACMVGLGECTAPGAFGCDEDGGTVCIGEPGPAAPEICDAADNDCNGLVDDGIECLCEPREERGCYAGPPDTLGIGLCRAGRQACRDSGMAFGACFGAVLPAEEICDGEDNDCDGVTDEGFADLGAACVAGQGLCLREGTIVCAEEGAEAICDAVAGEPVAEVCNGLDDDCDGQIDEAIAGVGAACAAGVGACEVRGQVICEPESGELVCDAVANPPQPEICDNLDNDCDARTDEAEAGGPLTEACFDGPPMAAMNGLCRPGVRTCEGGAFGACEGQILPGVEICDEIDNDCDGATDEEGAGGLACVCVPDEVRPCYGGPPGTDGVGRCRAGAQRCRPDGSALSICEGEVLPGDERCNGIDDDCDGNIDEALIGVDLPCAAGVGACAQLGTTVCDAEAGRIICDAVPGVPEAEVCDAQDNDCDGATDEDFDLGAACAEGVGACQREGQIRCAPGGEGVICGARPGVPEVEACNGADDDCDGATDEGEDGQPLQQACFDGPEGAQPGAGFCEAGVQTCVEGAFGACEGQVLPGEEGCNQFDDDCDGEIDEGPDPERGICPPLQISPEPGSFTGGLQGAASRRYRLRGRLGTDVPVEAVQSRRYRIRALP